MNRMDRQRGMRFAMGVFAVLLLAACAGPAPLPPASDVGSSTQARAGPDAAAGPLADAPRVFVHVQPGLREVVRRAAAGYPSLRGAVFADQAPPDADWSITMRFESRVDRSGQVSNQSGAAIGGPATLLLGAITPWPCPVRHTLTITIERRDGGASSSEVIVEDERRIGTMIWCPEVSEPDGAMATRLANALFDRLERDRVLVAPSAR
jgi:hypothetical protein